MPQNAARHTTGKTPIPTASRLIISLSQRDFHTPAGYVSYRTLCNIVDAIAPLGVTFRVGPDINPPDLVRVAERIKGSGNNIFYDTMIPPSYPSLLTVVQPALAHFRPAFISYVAVLPGRENTLPILIQETQGTPLVGIPLFVRHLPSSPDRDECSTHARTFRELQQRSNGAMGHFVLPPRWLPLFCKMMPQATFTTALPGHTPLRSFTQAMRAGAENIIVDPLLHLEEGELVAAISARIDAIGEGLAARPHGA